MDNISFSYKLFNELSREEIFEIYKLRNEVFIVEQECAYQDLDALDFKSIHILGKSKDKLITYARIIPPEIKFKDACSIGRFLVKKEFRGKGYADDMLLFCLNLIESLRVKDVKYETVRLSSQEYIKDFYAKFGFKEASEVYIEEFRPHLKMELKIKDRTRR